MFGRANLLSKRATGSPIAPRSTVGTLQVLDLLTALRALGIDIGALCRVVGLRTSMLQDPAASVPASLVVDLFDEAARRSGDPLIGLHAGEQARPRGPLAYLLVSSPRLDQGLLQLERFSRLAVDTLRLRVKRGLAHVRLVVDPGEPIAESPHAVDYVLRTTVQILRQAAGADFRLSEVHVRHPPWREQAEAARVFGCLVRYSRADDALVFPTAYLESVSRGANPLIAAQIEKFALAFAAQAAPAATFRQGVADATRALLAEGRRADRATVARQLRVSWRTMQRRLAEERTSFKAVRDTVLWEVVTALLSNRLLKVEAVALSVGFGDVAAFSKAFKRWAGCSATAYRVRLTTTSKRRRQLRLVTKAG